ncbi:DNA repair protein RecO [Adhaeribacter aquaticus]|uniref:DNA repair protein RecO n=1 Tax=Adhaeribacter aquaticus TaxID=299567 RepID=UPI0004136247|nr:DNA repair protein RecO [Adhaeribacter aquaticus]
MLVKTRGIVLNFIKYRETSIITRIYTEELGLQTYIVNSIRQKSNTTRIALFQPFTLLDMVVYTSAKGGITRISEYKCNYPFSSIPYDIRKSSMLLFLSEMLSFTVKEEEENRDLFNFLHNAIIAFDQQEQHFENFHLIFLLQLSSYLGFGPTSGADVTSQIAFSGSQNLINGRPAVIHFQMYEDLFDNLINDPTATLITNGKVRREMLQIIIWYYQLHMDSLGEIRSLKVLSEVLAE